MDGDGDTDGDGGELGFLLGAPKDVYYPLYS